jgi:hypothetical protein
MWTGRLTFRLVFAATLAAALYAALPGCDLLRPFNVDPNGEQAAVTKKPPAPGKYSFRQAPYTFCYDFDDLNREHPLFKELDGLRDQVARELHLPAGTTPITVYLFEDRPHFERFMSAHHEDLPTDRRAFFMTKSRTIGGPEDLLIYTFWGKNERIRQDLRHESTHALLHSVLREVPMWLDEGIAEFYELPTEAKGVNSTHVEMFRREIKAGTFKPNLARLEALTKVSEMNSPEYREAWAWVHLMLRSTPEAKKVLRNYLTQLKTNPRPGSLAARLGEVFPSPEEALKAHLLELDGAQ